MIACFRDRSDVGFSRLRRVQPSLRWHRLKRRITTDFDDEQFEQVAQSLERWLGEQATDDVPELVLVGLLRGYADAIEEYGYVPRSWESPEFSHTRQSRDSVSGGQQQNTSRKTAAKEK